MTNNLTARADALVEELLKRTIHVHYGGGYPKTFIIGRPHKLELTVRLHSLPWRATLTETKWWNDQGSYHHFSGAETCIRLSARLAWKLHRLAARLRRMQKRDETVRRCNEQERSRRARLERQLHILGTADCRLAQIAAGAPEKPET